jgi:hypothetical protein
MYPAFVTLIYYLDLYLGIHSPHNTVHDSQKSEMYLSTDFFQARSQSE